MVIREALLKALRSAIANSFTLPHICYRDSSSTCTVFAQEEMMSRLAEGAKVEDILAGLHKAIASRIFRMVERLKLENDIVVTGGGAKNIGLVRALEGELGCITLVPPEPLLTGAIGAALLGREMVCQATEKGFPLERKERRLARATFFA